MRVPCKDTHYHDEWVDRLPFQRPHLDRTVPRVSAPPHRGCVCPVLCYFLVRELYRRALIDDCCRKELVECEPEDTFYNFASGILAEMKREGDACKVSSMP